MLALLMTACISVKSKKEKTASFGGHLLYGNVKSFQGYLYNSVEKFGSNSEGNLICGYSCLFDEGGNKLEYNGYKSDGSLKYRYTYEYESGNNTVFNSYESDGSLTHKYKYEYDKEGRKLIIL